MSRLAVLIGCFVFAAACAVHSRPTATPNRMAELWEEPADLERRDLMYGPGGRALAPDPRARYELLEHDTNGFSASYEVKDARGQEWSVRLGPEARTEVVVSRLVWAVGYHQPFVYYLPAWTLAGNGTTATQSQARLRLKTPTMTKVDDWSWRDNPFLETRPFAGLFVLMVMVNNWDLRTPQNALYRVELPRDDPRHRYVVADLGAALGKTRWLLPGNRDNIEAFERERFINRVEGNRVTFHFQGAWREPRLSTIATPADVRWICGLLARLSAHQWQDAFRAGGYDAVETARYVRRLQEKVAEGLAVE